MSRVMYLDCFAGAAGDMLLGALVDAGLPVDALQAALGSLAVDHGLTVTRVTRAGLTATKIDVQAGKPSTGSLADHRADERAGSRAHVHSHGGRWHSHSHHDDPDQHDLAPEGHHSLREIAQLIESSALSASAKARAIGLFTRLGEAEAAIHGVSIDEVHLHEVGAVDSIIDIAGVVFGLEWFGVDDIVASPLNVGSGTVEIAHGTYPVPAPATLRLLANVPIYSLGPAKELVTPTGALLVSAYARAYGPMPAMVIERVGYGAGTKDFPRLPNVVRVVFGRRLSSVDGTAGERGGSSPSASRPVEQVVKIECEIDDMNPQLFGPLSDRLFEAGALDVFLTAVQMKKGRPGTLVTVLVPDDVRPAACELLFRETTTLGVRFDTMARETLERAWVDVPIAAGLVRVKIATRNGVVLTAAPEFDDCVRIANATGRPVRIVQDEALAAWRAKLHEPR